MNAVNLKRTRVVLHPDPRRVLLRPFLLSNDSPGAAPAAAVERVRRICANVVALPESEVSALWKQVQVEFGGRHAKTQRFLLNRFELVRPVLDGAPHFSEERALLLGAYLSHEYSLEAAALFNPSMVVHPDQSEVAPGSLRFVLSLRATGEGHISSITFRTGTLDPEGNVAINAPTRYCLEPEQVPNASYEKALFERKLRELGLAGDFTREALQQLGSSFTLDELRAAISRAAAQLGARDQQTEAEARKTLMVAQSNYEVQFPIDSRPCERVLFPTTPSQSNGIEDARFVRFRNDDGTSTYYATYTAYDGKMVLPQFIETSDFLHFKFITLNGPAVQNKGMALFPRKINGHYLMLSRLDHENIYVMFSDHLHFWHSAQRLLEPKFPWEFIQLGNCGSPIETDAGWLVLSHGVGPMRKYCIGAFLLDRDDPTKVIRRAREPLITPDENEREGYVPNVVYSCGSLLHGGQLVIPYAMSDYATTFATLSLSELLSGMDDA
jgi:predicted GH43/DUF377 family glycosyl hydrolase